MGDARRLDTAEGVLALADGIRHKEIRAAQTAHESCYQKMLGEAADALGASGSPHWGSLLERMRATRPVRVNQLEQEALQLRGVLRVMRQATNCTYEPECPCRVCAAVRIVQREGKAREAAQVRAEEVKKCTLCNEPLGSFPEPCANANCPSYATENNDE
jgi:hypothetical protein